jgi:DUF1365 family protein
MDEQTAARLEALQLELEALKAQQAASAQARRSAVRALVTLPITAPILLVAMALGLVAGTVRLVGKGVDALGDGLNRAARAIGGLS